MKITTLILALMTFVPSAYAQGIPAENIKLTSEEDLKLALPLQAELDSFSAAVSQCVSGGETPEACQCRNIDKVKSFKANTEAVFARRPEWNKPAVVLVVENWNGSAETRSTSLYNILHALEKSLAACPR